MELGMQKDILSSDNMKDNLLNLARGVLASPAVTHPHGFKSRNCLLELK